jgi:AcrR family transcriptional regulator
LVRIGGALMQLRTSETLESGSVVPKQARSRRAMDALVGSALELMKTRAFDEIPISEFARAAKVSVGNFYFRFPTKEVFLLHLGERLLIDIVAPAAAAHLAPERWKGTSLFDKVFGYFSYAAAVFQRHRAVMRPLAMKLDEMRDQPLRETANAFNAVVHGAFKRMVLEHADVLRIEDKEQALDDVLFWGSAAVRQLVLYRRPRPKAEQERILREISRGIVAYLTAAPAKRSRRP